MGRSLAGSRLLLVGEERLGSGSLRGGDWAGKTDGQCCLDQREPRTPPGMRW